MNGAYPPSRFMKSPCAGGSVWSPEDAILMAEDVMIVAMVVKERYRIHLDDAISVLYRCEDMTSRNTHSEYRIDTWIGVECDEEGRTYTPDDILFKHQHKDVAINAWKSKYPLYVVVIDTIIEDGGG